MSNDHYVLVPRSELLRWAKDWAAENDPGDGTDCVTPFDKHLHGTPDEEAHAWMRRWAFDKVDVMALPRAERPRGWQLREVTTAKMFDDDVPIYTAPPSAPKVQPVCPHCKGNPGLDCNSFGRTAPPSAPDVAMEAWHAAVNDAGELRSNASDERYAKRAASVEAWIKANRPAPPSAPVGVEGIIATDEAAWALAARAEAAGAERDSDDNGTWWTLRIEHFKALAQQPADPITAYYTDRNRAGWAAPRHATAAEYERQQPCGCVLCVCEDEKQCHGCGAKHCGNRTDHPAYVAKQPEAAGDGKRSQYMQKLWLNEWLFDHDIRLAADAYEELFNKLTAQSQGDKV